MQLITPSSFFSQLPGHCALDLFSIPNGSFPFFANSVLSSSLSDFIHPLICLIYTSFLMTSFATRLQTRLSLHQNPDLFRSDFPIQFCFTSLTDISNLILNSKLNFWSSAHTCFSCRLSDTSGQQVHSFTCIDPKLGNIGPLSFSYPISGAISKS